MASTLIPQNNRGIMVEGEEDGDLGSMSSSSSSTSSDSLSSSSLSSEFMEEDATSSSPTSNDQSLKDGPIFEMSSLMAQLPFKGGLSKFYKGKSQSFTCLSSVRSLEDLVKPERHCKKKLKTSMSCGALPPTPRVCFCSRIINKKASRGTFSSSINARKHTNSFGSSRPPIPPQRTTDISGRALLFA